MSGPDLLERTRMALAEAGYPNAEVKPLYGGIDCAIILSGPNAVPDEVCWRAHHVANPTGTVLPCWTCWDWGTADACLADRPLVRDCGIDR